MNGVIAFYLFREVLQRRTTQSEQLFILQSDSYDVSPGLIACARYNICNELCATSGDPVSDGQRGAIHVVFIIQLQRVAGGYFIGFQV